MADQLRQPSAPAATKEMWYGLGNNEAANIRGTSLEKGLSAAEAARRLESYGRNILEEEKEKSAWLRFLEQYTSYMQIVLVIAAIVSLFIREYRTFLLLFLLTVFNANLGYRQEAKAAASVAALNRMMKIVAKVRRDGEVVQIEADQIVPGDIVIVDAGDRVPADGHVVVTATLQIEESALTGERIAVEKTGDPIAKKEISLGDQLNMAFMNTNVMHGHGEILVTTTGMGSEVGHIATMLREQKAEKSPLTRQINNLTLIIIGLIILAVGEIFKAVIRSHERNSPVTV